MPWKYGFIGCGDMASTHLHSLEPLKDQVQIAALADTSAQRMDALAQKHGLDAAKYSDYRQLLQRPDLDAVFVIVPNFLHRQVTLEAFAAGKHVFCEKPMATTVDDCLAMIRASQAAGRVLQIGLVYRYSPLFRTMAKLIREGQIGQPQMMWLHEFRLPFPTGRGREWRYDQKATGGAMVEKNCHHFDLFNWMLDSMPRRVAALGGNDMVGPGKPVPTGVPGEGYAADVAGDILDNAWVIVEYDNRARASLGLSLFTSGYRLPVGVLGSRGWIEADEKAKELILCHHDGAKSRRVELPAELGQEIRTNHTGGTQQHLEFIQALRTGQEPPSSGWVGLYSVQPAIAAESAVRDRRVVDLDRIDRGISR